MVLALRKASVKKIVVVVPYYGYTKQNRKTTPRIPKSTTNITNLLKTVGVNKIILVNIHSRQIQGDWYIEWDSSPQESLEAQLVALDYFVEQKKFPM